MEQPETSEQPSMFFIQVAHAGLDTGVKRTVSMLWSDVFVFGCQQVCFAVLYKGWQRDGAQVECTTEQAQAEGMPIDLAAEFFCQRKVCFSYALWGALAEQAGSLLRR